MTDRNTGKSNWRIRRAFMFSVSAFCALTIGYVLVKGVDTSPADTAVTMAFLTLVSIVGSYVFGATWEDANVRKLQSAAAPPPAAVGSVPPGGP